MSARARWGGMAAMSALVLPTAILLVPGVSVTPDGEFVSRPENSGQFTETFFVQNNGTTLKTYNLYCAGTISVVCDNVLPTVVTLSPNAQLDIDANYHTTAAPQSSPPWSRLKVWAIATVGGERDTGYYSVAVTTSAPPAPPIATIADPSPGPIMDRSLCLTAALPGDAASECGDLRLAHALPLTRTMNKARVPTLLYNSQHAAPFPVVAANVTLPAGAGVPQQVVARLTIGGVLQPERQWPGSSWTAGSTRRVAIGADGLNLGTGIYIYPYSLEVINQYSGSSLSDTVTGELVVVNRKDSPFGAGWWLAGLERLDSLASSTKLWIGGDGSVRRYAPAGANRWAAANVDRPDTLLYDGTHYVRLLPGGLRVKFRTTDGRHVQTVNRLGHVTVFGYDVACGRLSTIKLPPDTASRVYQFAYSSPTDCAQRLLTVTAPPIAATPRVTNVTITSGRVTAIQDPDLSIVNFGNQGTNRVTSRTDRRGSVTTFSYDGGYRVAQASLNMGAGQTAVTLGVRALETVGLSTAVDTAWASAQIDGPRTGVTDTTIFWLERFGQPRRIRNALGHTTLIKRESATWPALATEVVAPNGLVTRATYDARGNVDTSIVLNPLGDGRNAVTRYQWDPVWDQVTKIVPPERDSMVLAYDAVTGNRLWQQDARGTTGRTEFFYYSAPDSVRGLLRSTRTPSQTLGGPRDSVSYDGRGNLRGVKTPLGFWSYSYADDVGRDTLVTTPTDSTELTARRQLQRVFYDIGGRDTLTRSVGPTLPYRPTGVGFDSLFTAPETLWVRKRFDAEGNLDSLRRWGVPNPATILPLTTRYVYDRAHRVVVEKGPDNLPDSTFYDPAGNADSVRTRRGHKLRMTYDALNRLTQRITPAVSYPYWATPGVVWHFPFYREDATGGLNTLNGGAGGNYGLVIAADTASFTYDSLGNMRTANNRDARITRTYYRGGALQSDTQRIRTYLGTDFTQHIYTLTYTVDLNGRRVTLTHPSQLATGATGPVTYHYDAIGRLDSLRSVLGHTYVYGYDLESRPITLLGRSEDLSYDTDGRMIRRSDPYHADTLRYDARGKVRRAGTMADSSHTRYTGLGAVVWSQTRRYQDPSTHPEEQYVIDPVANVRSVFRRENGTQILELPTETRSTYDTVTGRLVFYGSTDSGNVTFPNPPTISLYDSSGNRHRFERQTTVLFNGSNRTLEERTLNYYGADGKLRVADRRTCIFLGSVCQQGWGPDFTERQAFEEYRYDALGRRVLLRTRADWGCGVEGCRRLLQRFVWDGAQLLYEISAPQPQMESDAPPAPHLGFYNPSNYFFTGTVGYTHGLELDAPLDLIRRGHSDMFPGPDRILPFTTWRGDYDVGILPACRQEWGPDTTTIEVTDSTLYNFCMEAQWPAPYLWVSKFSRARANGPNTWLGSLAEGQRDLTGQLYRRNRYYDPASGRFTQEDPIGLAGGLNLYGFAAGDPVNFSDPFGLAQCPSRPTASRTGSGAGRAAGAASEAAGRAETLGSRIVSGLGKFGRWLGRVGAWLSVGGLIFEEGHASPEAFEARDAMRAQREALRDMTHTHVERPETETKPRTGSASATPPPPPPPPPGGPSKSSTTGSGANVTNTTPNRTTAAGGTPCP